VKPLSKVQGPRSKVGLTGLWTLDIGPWTISARL
jgi:hypothetical protein